MSTQDVVQCRPVATHQHPGNPHKPNPTTTLQFGSSLQMGAIYFSAQPNARACSSLRQLLVPRSNSMARRNPLRRELSLLEQTFPRGHSQFQITSANMDEVTCVFVGPPRFRIQCNISVRRLDTNNTRAHVVRHLHALLG